MHLGNIMENHGISSLRKSGNPEFAKGGLRCWWQVQPSPRSWAGLQMPSTTKTWQHVETVTAY